MKKYLLLTLTILLAIVGCQTSAPPAAPATAPESSDVVQPDPQGDNEVIVVSRVPEEFATPLPGNANLGGIIASTTTNQPLIQLPIQLAEVIRGEDGVSGNFILDIAQSPTTYTDTSGTFLFANIPAGEYVMVVGNAEVNRYEIVAQEDGRPRVFTAVADQLVNTDTILVKLEWFSGDNIPAPAEGGYPAPSLEENSYP